MISIIVGTHGNFGVELVKSAEMIFGKQDQVTSVAMAGSDSLDVVKEKFTTAINQYSNENQVLLLTDLFGGTPFNVCAQIVAAESKRFELVAGVNLGMVLESFTSLNVDVHELADHLVSSGQQAIRKFEMPKDEEDDLI